MLGVAFVFVLKLTGSILCENTITDGAGLHSPGIHVLYLLIPTVTHEKLSHRKQIASRR